MQLSKQQLIQLSLEQHYSRDNNIKLIQQELNTDSEELWEKIEFCARCIMNWAKEDYYDSKNEMLAVLTDIEPIKEMIGNMLCTIILMKNAQLTAVIAQVIKYLPWKRGDYLEYQMILRAGEILYHMAKRDLIEMYQSKQDNIMYVTHAYVISDEILERIALTKFPPPMVCKPNKIRCLKDSTYLMTRGKVMSKWWNQREGRDLRYDYLNKINAIPFSIDLEYMRTVDREAPVKEYVEDQDFDAVDIEKQKQLWEKIQVDTIKIGCNLYSLSNKLYFNNFYCARMRVYKYGFHFNPQGTSDHKATLDFWETDIIEVEDKYKDLFKKPKSEPMIKYVSGNILLDTADAIVNPVNVVGVMGKGLALQFKQEYPQNFKEYKSACDSKQLTTGKVLTVQERDKYIINFPTKAHWRDKSEYSYIESGLDALIKEIKQLNIKSIAIPKLGAGLGGLDWNKVEKIILNKFKDITNVEIRLYADKPSKDTSDIECNEIHEVSVDGFTLDDL